MGLPSMLRCQTTVASLLDRCVLTVGTTCEYAQEWYSPVINLDTDNDAMVGPNTGRMRLCPRQQQPSYGRYVLTLETRRGRNRSGLKLKIDHIINES